MTFVQIVVFMSVAHPLLLRSPHLRLGDVVGLAAASSSFDPEAFDRGVDIIKRHGYIPKYTSRVFDKSSYLAGHDSARAAELNSLITDQDVKAILFIRGGYGVARLLPQIDMTALAARPVLLAGFSDITALLAAAYSGVRLVSIHGPLVTSLADKTDPASQQRFFDLLAGETDGQIVSSEAVTLRPGRAEGPLLGGNLSVLCHLAGTPYFPNLAGAVLLLEDRGEAPYRIDRMLTHLKLTGQLNQVAGLVLGRFTECGSPEQLHQVFLDVLGDLSIPILSEFPVGHGPQNMAWSYGEWAVLETEAKRLVFPYEVGPE
ncbi:MAG: LD-carboxypeptidase [Deltaproteobacteria bacterium]|nr:LD-carboxypeptidase [Deltaproteobacteria bacterium]